jgi:sulfate adenylyltransferase
VTAGEGHWAELLAALEVDGPLPPVAAEGVLRALRRWRPPPSRRGVVVLLTGLSGAGKSTLAQALAAHISETSERTVSLLDGDLVRRLLSAGLGFDRAARDLNVRRNGFVAAEIARHGGIAICALIAPYAQSRAAIRAMAEEVGDFVLVHVSTPLAEAERRDVKGLYARARAGQIEHFTGISDPYEEPADADITIDTSVLPLTEGLQQIVDFLDERGSLPPVLRRG